MYVYMMCDMRAEENTIVSDLLNLSYVHTYVRTYKRMTLSKALLNTLRSGTTFSFSFANSAVVYVCVHKNMHSPGQSFEVDGREKHCQHNPVVMEHASCNTVVHHLEDYRRMSEPSIIQTPLVSYTYCTCTFNSFQDGGQNIYQCVHNVVLWLIHCGAKEKERCIIS